MSKLYGNHGPDVTDRVAAQAANGARPKGCRNKRRFPGRKQALTALNAMRALDPGDPDIDLLVVYKCPHGCHGWHVGHNRRVA